jgi:hypothetical protein
MYIIRKKIKISANFINNINLKCAFPVIYCMISILLYKISAFESQKSIKIKTQKTDTFWGTNR